MTAPRPSGPPWLTLALSVGVLLVWWVDEMVGRAFELERAALAHGQWWRLLTGHFTHWSADHLAWDVLVFVVVGSLFECRAGRARWATLVAGSSLAIALGVLMLRPDIARFRGLSGIDCALVVALATTAWYDAMVRGDRPGAILQAALLLGYGVKTVLELRTGLTIFVQATPEGFRAVPLAHIVGGMAGMVGSLCFYEAPRDGRAATQADQPTPPVDATTRSALP